MAYLRSDLPKPISTFGDVTLTGTQTLTNKTFTTPTVGSMTNYTFPAGHTVQHSAQFVGTTYTSGSSQNNHVDSVVTGTITPKYNNSDILLITHFSTSCGNTTGDAGWSVQWERNISGGATSTPTDLRVYSGSGNTHGMHYFNLGGSYDMGLGAQYVVLDDNALGGGSIAEITYVLQYATYNTESFVFGTAMSGKWFCQFMEIKR